jgi:NADH-quinone oxidoreductase subunit N
MNAPVIWIIVPLILAALTSLFRRGRVIVILGGATTLLLAGISLLIPIDTALAIGPLSLKIAPSLQILGRRIVLNSGEQPLLTITYGLAAFWFFGAEAAGVARRLIPVGLAILALLVASVAVQPFLYAALLIEIAALLAVPLLSPPNKKSGRGVVRFLIYQTLAMPFILFAGWLLAGVEASPADIALVAQIAILLGLGFAFLLAIFPLYTWILLLAEETSSYALGFILWLLPLTVELFGLGFLDHYTFLRESPRLVQALQVTGLLMLVTGGLGAAFERHLGRLMGYAVVAQTGMSLLAVSLGGQNSIPVFFLLLVPHALGLGIWTLSLSVFQHTLEPVRFNTVQGMARLFPFASAGIVLANLSAVGIPLLAGFPVRLVLWEGLSEQSLGVAFWFGIGILGLLAGAIRTLAVLVMAPTGTQWQTRESWQQRMLLGLGIGVLFLLGLFPQIIYPIIANLPLAYEHLGH